jgi:hypothetical protein
VTVCSRLTWSHAYAWAIIHTHRKTAQEQTDVTETEGTSAAVPGGRRKPPVVRRCNEKAALEQPRGGGRGCFRTRWLQAMVLRSLHVVVAALATGSTLWAPVSAQDLGDCFNPCPDGREVASVDSCTLATNSTKVFIGGIFSTAPELAGQAREFRRAAAMINDHTDGMWDDLLVGTEIEVAVDEVDCGDSTGAMAAFVRQRLDWGRPLHGVVGPRCSGQSQVTARIAGLDKIPLVSYSATNPVRLRNAFSSAPAIAPL